MYHSMIQRPSATEEEDERMRRERGNGNGNGPSQNLGAYARSPTQTDFPQPAFTQSPVHSRPSYINSSYPPSAAVPLPLPLSSPTLVARHPASPLSAPPHQTYSSEYQSTPRDKQTSNYYDPTSDSSERRPSEAPVWYNGHPPPTQERYQASSTAPDQIKYYNGTYNSPVDTGNFVQRSPVSHSHPPSRIGSISHSPIMAKVNSPIMRHSNGVSAAASYQPEISHPPTVNLDDSTTSGAKADHGEIQRPARAADPMSFSSILSSADPAPPTPTTLQAPPQTLPPPQKQPKKAVRPSLTQMPSDEQLSRISSRRSSSNNLSTPPASRVPAKRQANGLPKPRPLSIEQEKEVLAAIASIDAEASDIDVSDAEFDAEKQLFKARSLKRKLEVDQTEQVKQKKRRTNFVKKTAKKLKKHATAGEARYKLAHGEEAIMMVQQKEVDAEKERKKDMQRKRRREKTAQNALEQKNAALTKAQQALQKGDETEARKYEREAEKAEKKAAHTKLILARGDKGPEIREVSPMAPNFQGGTMTTFAAETEVGSGKKPAKGRGGARPRKSKEQKQAEKDSAVRAQAAIDAGAEEQLLLPLPKEPKEKEEPKLKAKAGSKEAREASTPPVSDPFATKGYLQIYDQIWRDIARKDVTKVHKLASESNQIKASNLKKTAILASKEAKRWQLRTNKSAKDLQARAKRVMREMMTFWKRNEREERDTRRAAEKQEIESLKKQEADREASRQKRKLNFLISQTELYSHFIGKKINTEGVERSTDHPDVAVSAATSSAGTSLALKLPETGAAPGKVTNFEDLDFDAADDSALTAAAMANAQNAIKEAQDKARAFNESESAMNEEGELNFQNPAGMGDVDIEQPKMLQAQLKEYQLKGLNWLVNLYEQGINGILADEMGLGKTVQSISVMAYLAEKHDIWGPFLVVAPASTLHNWQQEITKFVPTLKVLPYWGTAGDRKVLRKFWDRKHMRYTQDAPFHVLITSYQLVVSDVAYFQKMKWQYMILDEAQAIKSSQSSRWKSLLGFHCRNRLLLTGTPIQNNMQELWALLHFIMPSLFDSHDEFSEWFSKDIESHAQSNTKLNEDQLKRLHMILKPFMLRRVKKHVQKELGDKIEKDVFCDLTYRQRAYYTNLRNQISIMDLIEKATIGDDQDSGTLMNLVMQFRKVCNHPDLFERAETRSPLSFAYFAETASFMREGPQINVGYSTRNLIQYSLPKLIWREGGRLDLPGDDNPRAGFNGKYLNQLMNIWSPENTKQHSEGNEAFSWLRFTDTSPQDISEARRKGVFSRAVQLSRTSRSLGRLRVLCDEEDEKPFTPAEALFRIVDQNDRVPLAEATNEGYLRNLFNVAQNVYVDSGLNRMEKCGGPAASAPPVEVHCSSRGAVIEKENLLFNVPMRRALYGPSTDEEKAFIESDLPQSSYPASKMLPAPISEKQRFTNISVPSMRRFVTDSGKLAKLDELLFKLKEGGHRVLLYFQMTRMIDLMEEYLTYRNYKYLRLDGSTKLEDRRDTVHDFQTRPEIFIFLLSTRAGGLGINLTSADTVIFYDSDWNPTIDSQAMDRAHRLGQTRQVTVYRMITRGTIEERIRKRALQKEEVQRVVISGGSGGGVDFNSRSKENRTKDIAMWFVDDEQAAEIERKEAELAALEAKQEATGGKRGKGKKKKVESASLEDLYHEGEGHFDDGSAKPSGTATPISTAGGEPAKGKKRKSTGTGGGGGKKAKTAKQRLMMADGDMEM